jgi:hypothetical protein
MMPGVEGIQHRSSAGRGITEVAKWIVEGT